VRHILVKSKAKADQLRAQLEDGGDFAALAKANSEDTGSKANGGKLTISKGQTVAPFDQTAFLLTVNQISRPVKTEYGYHIIQPLSAVKDATTKPLDKALRDQIRQQLLSTKREEAMNTWIKDLPKEYDGKVSYADGFAPSTSNVSGTTTG
jgi:foldase protein PrsA